MRDVTFGQYYPAESPIHKLDPRCKIFLSILYIVLIFIVKNFYGFILCAALAILVIILSKVPFKSVLRSLRMILFLTLFMIILNLLFYDGESEPLLVIGGKTIIKKQAAIDAGFLALRLVLLVLGTCMLTLTTSPVDLTEGIERLLKPLTYLRFPAHELALIMSIALRFIPILMEETDRIIKAQKSRGADFESGNLFKRLRALVPILIPLLVSAFRRAEELGDAMDARCYCGSKGRTVYKLLKYSFRDLIAVIVIAASFAGVILLNIYFGAI